MTLHRQLARFLAIGVVSTVAYIVLYALLRTATDAVAVNLVALIATALGNTAANRRLTFGVRGRSGLAVDHAVGLVAFGVALAITTGAIALLRIVAPDASTSVEIVVLVAASVLATMVRFGLLRLRLSRSTWPANRSNDAAGRLLR